MEKIKFDKLFFYDEIDSTQKEIWRRVQSNNIESGTVIVAGKQTDAIGTHGRVWYTDESNNVAFSFYIKTDINVGAMDGLTYEIAEDIVEVFKSLYGIVLEIKMPNDIVFNNKKIGGILTETKIVGESVNHLVIGIGVNTNQTKFICEIKDIASSIKNEFGISIDNMKFINKFLDIFGEKFKKRMEDN